MYQEISREDLTDLISSASDVKLQEIIDRDMQHFMAKEGYAKSSYIKPNVSNLEEMAERTKDVLEFKTPALLAREELIRRGRFGGVILPKDEDLSFKNALVSYSNEAVFETLKQECGKAGRKQGNVVIITGKAGVGKTYALKAVRNKFAKHLKAEEVAFFNARELNRHWDEMREFTFLLNKRCLIIDDLHLLDEVPCELLEAYISSTVSNGGKVFLSYCQDRMTPVQLLTFADKVESFRFLQFKERAEGEDWRECLPDVSVSLDLKEIMASVCSTFHVDETEMKSDELPEQVKHARLVYYFVASMYSGADNKTIAETVNRAACNVEVAVADVKLRISRKDLDLIYDVNRVISKCRERQGKDQNEDVVCAQQ